MAQTPQYMLKVAGWEQTIGAFVTNAQDFERFTLERFRLEEITSRFKTLINQRAAFEASKQDTTREIQELFQEAETLVDHMRTAVRNFYGLNSDKLIEFGIRPSRSRTRRSKPPEPEPPAPEAPVPAAAPEDEQ